MPNHSKKRLGVQLRQSKHIPPEALEWHRARVIDAARLLNRSVIREPALVEAVCSRLREYDREVAALARAASPGPKSWANQFTTKTIHQAGKP